jgi:hypothetical protein
MNLLAIMSFIETYSFEPTAYLVAPVPEAPPDPEGWPAEDEIRWERARGPRSWGVRRRKADEDWRWCTPEELLAALGERGARVDALESELSAIAFTQVVHGEVMLRDAADLFGSQRVAGVIEGYDAFAEELVSLLRPATPGMIDGGGEGGDPRRGHLRLLD